MAGVLTPALALCDDLPCDGLVPVKFAEFACSGAWLCCAAAPLQALPGRLQLDFGAGVGSAGSMVRPVSMMASAPQLLVSLRVMLVTVLPGRVRLSMSITASVPSVAVPLQTLAAAGSERVPTTMAPAPMRHSRR